MREFVRALNGAKNSVIAHHDRHLDRQPEAAILLAKITNLLLAKYEYRHRRIHKFAKPIGFMLDPANSCQLGCPTCQNSSNADYVVAIYKSIPRAAMKEDLFTAFIDGIGAMAFTGHFYNNHEPFLNKRTPDFIRCANDYRIDTLVSSNLSLPRLDAEAIVSSGLQTLMVAIDGVTRPSYARYRRGGNIEHVFENVRRIAEARRRLGRRRPYLRWQYLTFEHNVHEIEKAIDIAPKLGFDSLNLATPYDVSADEPTVRAVEYAGPEHHKNLRFTPEAPQEFVDDLASRSEIVHSLLHEDLEARFLHHAASREANVDAAVGTSICDWLHFGMVVDATGRVGSCCISDFKRAGRIYQGSVAENGDEVYNSGLFMAARTLLAQPEEYALEMSALPREERPFCDGCTGRPLPQVGLAAAQHYLQHAPLLAHGAATLRGTLASWSEHDYNMAPSDEAPSLAFGGELDAGSLAALAPDFADRDLEEETFRRRYFTATGMPNGDSRVADMQGHYYAFLRRRETRELAGGARILDVLLVQDNKLATNIVSSKAVLSMLLKVRYDRAIACPIVGLTLSDVDRRPLVATNSSWAGGTLPPADANSTAFYRFDVNLEGATKYMSIEPAVAKTVADICDRRTNVLALVVSDEPAAERTAKSD